MGGASKSASVVMSAAPVGVTSSPCREIRPTRRDDLRARHVNQLHRGRRGRRQRPLASRYHTPTARQWRRVQLLDRQGATARPRLPTTSTIVSRSPSSWSAWPSPWTRVSASSSRSRTRQARSLTGAASVLPSTMPMKSRMEYAPAARGLVRHRDQRAADHASMNHL